MNGGRDNLGYAAELGYGPRLGGPLPAYQKLIDAETLVTRFTQKAEQKARDLRGRFTSTSHAMKQAFELAAQDLQRFEAEALLHPEQGLRRPQGAEAGRPEQHLVKALLSEHNRRVTFDGMAVNLTEWLNSPQSKVNLYWRGLEEGTTKHVGQVIYGYFLGVDGAPFAATMERRYLDPRMIVTHSSKELRVGAEHGIKTKSNLDKAHQALGFFQIKNRIEAEHFIRRGTKAWEESGSLKKRIKQTFEANNLRMQETKK